MYLTDEQARDLLTDETETFMAKQTCEMQTTAMVPEAAAVAAMKRAFDAGVEWQQELNSHEF